MECDAVSNQFPEITVSEPRENHKQFYGTKFASTAKHDFLGKQPTSSPLAWNFLHHNSQER